jgi:hypothetical protein
MVGQELATNEEGTVALTQRGRAFLEYIERTGRPERLH